MYAPPRPALLLVLALAACGSDEDDARECTPSPAGAENVWRDGEGRTVMYRGVNLGTAKLTADHLPPVDAADYARMASWGMTSIRLVVFWEAIEPERGVYDEVYLDGVRAHAELAAAAGLDVLIDMHQDVYGSGFGFVGFPRWTCEQAIYDAYEPPSLWFLGYLTTPVTECFDRFWSSTELRGAYARASARLAEHVADVAGVVAFEVINEPYWGSNEADFEVAQLQPFSEEVAAAVRAVAPRFAIVVEPSVGHNFGIPPELETPFGCPTFMYAPHYYPYFANEPYVDERVEMAQGIAALVDEARALGAPLAVTEVGMEAQISGSADYFRHFFDIFDDLPASTWIWDYGPDVGFALVGHDREPRDSLAGVVRPYVTRLAGTLVDQGWDPAAGVYTLAWDSSGAEAATEIVLPDVLFPNGYDINGDAALTSEARPLRLHVTAPAGPASLNLTRR